MNKLSQRLYRAMAVPLARTVKPSLSNYPSAASIKTIGKDGRPTVIGGCNREQWYRRKGIPSTEEFNINWALSAVQGDYLHEMMSDLIETHGFSMGLQRISKEHGIYDNEISLSGRSDYLAWDLETQEPIGIEFKSVGDWKSKKCLEEPAVEHVMQSMLYLDFYQRHIPKGQKAPTKWYIWYIARGEGWHLKGAKQLSPFVQLWDFYITLDNEGVPTVHTPAGIMVWDHLSIQGIRDRYKELEQADKTDTIPDRDFELSYAEEVIAGLYKHDMLELKMHKEAVRKWLENGAEKGKLNLDLGDFACRACGWKSLCWGLPITYKPVHFNLPEKEQPTEEDNEETKLSLL